MIKPTRAQMIALIARVKLANEQGWERVELDTKAIGAVLIHYTELAKKEVGTT